MKSYEIYNLVICVVVFVVMTGLLSYLIGSYIRSTLRLTRAGLNDEKIEKEIMREVVGSWKKRRGGAVKAADILFSLIICLFFGAMLCLSLYSRFTENSRVEGVPTAKVVMSGSMESKHPNNAYLLANELDNQIQVFDLILLHELPPEDELQLYDIVVYETNGYFILHRIVAIEEPNERHPDEKWFLLQGDANRVADDFPVTYEQMRSIYKNERIPFIGSFVFFMQSPAGMLCFILVVFAMISVPIAESKIEKAKRERRKYILYGEVETKKKK